MILHDTIREELRAYMFYNNISYGDIGKEIGLHEDNVRKLVNGDYITSIGKVRKLGRMCNIDKINSLFGTTDDIKLNDSILHKLREYRIMSKGMRLDEFSTYLGYSVATYSKLERGVKIPCIVTLYDICNACGINEINEVFIE